jgi:hypothetical protein
MWFLKDKTKLDANSQFLQVCHFTEIQELQNALNINTHTHQVHKNTVLCHSNTLILHCTRKIYAMFAEMSKCVRSYKANPDI